MQKSADSARVVACAGYRDKDTTIYDRIRIEKYNLIHERL